MEASGLRPLGVGEVLDVAFKIYKRHAVPLFKIVLFVVLPLQLLGAIVFLSTVDDPDAVTGFGEFDSNSDTEAAGAVVGTVVVSVLGGLAVLLATAACMKAVADAYLRRTPDWKESLRAARSRLGSLIWLTVLFFLLLIPAFIALVIPGIWLAIAWTVAYPVLMLEGIRGRKALGRSYRLVKGRWWPSFGVVVISYLIAAMLQFIVGALMAVLLLFGVEDSLLGTVVVNAVGNTIAGVIATPFQAAAVALLYFDLRVRKEGLDIELLARDVGIDPPDGPALGHEPPPAPTPVVEGFPSQAPGPEDPRSTG